jgi:hypothetical protein
MTMTMTMTIVDYDYDGNVGGAICSPSASATTLHRRIEFDSKPHAPAILPRAMDRFDPPCSSKKHP